MNSRILTDTAGHLGGVKATPFDSSIPAIRDRVVPGALKLILEPVLEADFQPGSYGYRPKRTAHDAIKRSLRGVMRPHCTPKLKKRTALLRELKEVFRRHRSQPVERVISLINPKLRGWVNYFAIGHSSECFSYIREWVEK